MTTTTVQGVYLDNLLGFFTNAATPEDAILIRAMFMTPRWAGRAAERPAFAITSAEMGTGKSCLAEAVGLLHGGSIYPQGGLVTALCHPQVRDRRVAVIDLMPSSTLASSVLAGILSSKHLSTGAAYSTWDRPNDLTYLMTGTRLQLSCDLADRCMILHVITPPRNPAWYRTLYGFIDTYRAEILADIDMALNSAPTRVHITQERWMPWIDLVLARCTSDPVALGQVVHINTQRQQSPLLGLDLTGKDTP